MCLPCVRAAFGIVGISWAAGNAVKRTGRMLLSARETGGAATESDRDPGSTAPAERNGALTEVLSRVGGWRLAVILLINQTLILVVAGLTASMWGPREPFKGSWDELVIRGRDLVSQVLANWQRWDALWYQHIAESGYRADDGSTAFFPLYPFLARGLSSVLGGSLVAAELVVSSVAYVGALWLLWKLVRVEVLRLPGRTSEDDGSRARRLLLVPVLAVLLTALAPSGFFLLAPYTESLFLLLTVASFWFMRTGHLWTAGAVGFLASLTGYRASSWHFRWRTSMCARVGRSGGCAPDRDGLRAPASSRLPFRSLACSSCTGTRWWPSERSESALEHRLPGGTGSFRPGMPLPPAGNTSLRASAVRRRWSRPSTF